MMRSFARRAVARSVIAVSLAAAIPLHSQRSLEYDVKAALLLNFARFIEWPDAAFPDARAPINVCVFGGGNPFGDTLERTLSGETAGNRTLAARHVKSLADSAGCHLLFVPTGAESRAGAILHQQGSYAVSVGESPRFGDMGGAVTLVLEEGRVRFKVNLQPVERRGIRISARMLQAASRVDRTMPAR
jgi:uncharacterized protein DUF4154